MRKSAPCHCFSAPQGLGFGLGPGCRPGLRPGLGTGLGPWLRPGLGLVLPSQPPGEKEFQKQKDHKLVVFFSTARAVGFFAAFFNQGLGIDVFELHSRKKQGYRDRVSKQFRNSKSGILFTSDVSARGKNDSIY